MQIPAAVLDELSRATIAADGLRLTLGRQVPHAFYTQIDNVLQALGGRWDRRAKAHVFPIDLRPRLEAALAGGNVTTDADLGFFQTPEPLARQLVRMADVRPGDTCLEPSAGGGRIVAALLEAAPYSVIAIERHADRRRALISRAKQAHDWCVVLVAPDEDFMAFNPDEPFDRVVMNPPFLRCGLGDHLDHVRHAYGMLTPGGVLVSVLPTGVQFRVDKRHTAFRQWAEAHGTITDLPDDSFKASGTSVGTCVVCLVGGAP